MRFCPFRRRLVSFGLVLFVATVGVVMLESKTFAGKRRGLDNQLRAKLRNAGVVPFDPGPAHSEAKILLGQALFFDKELSGNRDVSCATCHHPFFDTGDALSLSIGVGGEGLGAFRVRGEDRGFIPRNAPEIFNRGVPQWHSQFWDSRIEAMPDGGFITPAGQLLPDDLESVLAAQAMFPVTSRDEMRGAPDDVEGVNGSPNELSQIDDADLHGIWDALILRLLWIEGYQDLFAAAYPNVLAEALGFQHAANAIAAFEAEAFTLLDSAFDQYVAGDTTALTQKEKRGAVLFFGKARCAKCHKGSLLTDQQHYNLAVPQLGPGKGMEAPLDFGRGRETGELGDMFAFRTPPLRNVVVTGPWMHNGAYTSLEGAVRHHMHPIKSLLSYDKSQLDAELQDTVQDDPESLKLIALAVDRSTVRPIRLSKREFDELMSFLETLTSPSLQDINDTVPAEVPSGLPVDGVE